MVVKCFEDKMTVKCKQLSGGRREDIYDRGLGKFSRETRERKPEGDRRWCWGTERSCGEDGKYQGLGGASVVSLGEARIVR